MAAPNRRKFIGSTSTESSVAGTLSIELLITPFVNIVVPVGNPTVTQSNYTIIFNWKDVSDNELTVEDFSVEDIKVSFIPLGSITPTIWKDFDIGEVANRVTTFQNSQNNDDPDSSYNITISPPGDIVGRVVIEVRENGATSFGHSGTITDIMKFLLIELIFTAAVVQIENYTIAFNQQGPPEDSTNRIASFQIDNRFTNLGITGADKVCTIDKNISTNDWLNEVMYSLPLTDGGILYPNGVGGVFSGILESIIMDNYIYGVVQIRKIRQVVDDNVDLITDNIFEDNAQQAGAVLFRVNMNNCTFEVLRSYFDVSTAARSLVADVEKVKWIEGSHYMYHDDSQFRKSRAFSADIDPTHPTGEPDDFDSRELSVEWKKEVGKLYSITNTSSTINFEGLNWRSATTEDNPNQDETDYYYGRHGGTASPMLVVDGILNMVTGYGNFDDVQEVGEFPLDRIGNWIWIQVHNQLNQRIPLLLTNERTGYDVLRDISILTQSIIGFDKDVFFMTPRESRLAYLQTTLPDNGTSFQIQDYNRSSEIPDNGTLMINGEIIEYDMIDRMDNTLSMINRGLENTEVETHTVDLANGVNPEVYFIDHILTLNQRTLAVPINEISINHDFKQLHNRVMIHYGGDEPVLKEDKDSINANGDYLLELTIPTDSHSRTWAVIIAESLLKRFKDPKQIIDVKLKTTLYMKTAQTVFIKIPNRVHLSNACQVLEINQDFKSLQTNVKLVSIS